MEANESINTRSLEDIASVLDFAKLDRSEIKSETQSVYFSEHLDSESFRLLELDKAVLEAIENGEKVVLRGDKEDCAVLCTDSQTFEVKQGEISNAMLILPNIHFGPELSTNDEPSVRYNEFTFNELLDLVQGSENEINTALHKMQALIIDGYWRVLDFDFLVQVMGHLLQLCDENDWTHSGVPIEEDLETDKMDVTAMLTKVARASMSKGIKVYNSRKPLT
ncbi:DCC1-like protein [Mya arenaria]|uniref:Sister chromatid cohesion protein DCC1 n=1 Tax=Mya arenaria TaxID=6604 RepID=A0ABY7FTC0_MYAAR|nr:DCC1-like protein [Mya arenaria]